MLHAAIHPGGRFLTPAECSICQAVRNAQGLKLDEPARRTHGVLSHKDRLPSGDLVRAELGHRHR